MRLSAEFLNSSLTPCDLLQAQIRKDPLAVLTCQSLVSITFCLLRTTSLSFNNGNMVFLWRTMPLLFSVVCWDCQSHCHLPTWPRKRPVTSWANHSHFFFFFQKCESWAALEEGQKKARANSSCRSGPALWRNCLWTSDIWLTSQGWVVKHSFNAWELSHILPINLFFCLK